MDQSEFKKKLGEGTFEKLSKKELRKLVEWCLEVDDKTKENKRFPRGTSRLIILMEELAELCQETSKFIRGKGDKDHILEEIADVRISIDYLEHLINAKEEELDHAIRIKADRLRTGTEKYLEEYLDNHPKKNKKKKKNKKGKKGGKKNEK